MKEENVIEVHDVYKKFRNYYDRSHNLKERMIHLNRNKKYDDNQVLRGISFDVRKGEAVGLIGRNGCGKSTTLKLLTKIIYPDQGNIEIKGRVSSLLELGAGFHPDLSGFENIYLNAAVFGLTRKEIDQRVDDIIRFSELKDYINNPIRTYSSGMYMKLAFSVAINVEADILLIDEILGVGDVSFQKKCFEKLVEIKEKGTTIVIVSHSTDQIERICDRSIWIEEGVIKMMGEPKDIHRFYLETMEQRRLARKELEKQELEEKKKAEEEKQNREERRKKKTEKSLGDIDEKLKQEFDKQEELRQSLEERIQDRENRKKAENFEMNRKIFEEVLNDKKIEIEYLNSVIRQKEHEKERVASAKDDEIMRLEDVILEKDAEINRLNKIIAQKDEQIKKLLEDLAN